MSPDLDLNDPAIRRMAESNHEPEEIWTTAGTLVSVFCRQCCQSWPCETVMRLRNLAQTNPEGKH